MDKPTRSFKLVDPREQEEDYEKWRKEHQAAIRERAQADMESVFANKSMLDAPVALLAAVTGLSDGTIRRYGRRKKRNSFGSRGPLYTTYLAMRLLNRV